MGERNHTVDVLRAVAAVSVMLFHFAQPSYVPTPGPICSAIYKFGWLGVIVFFVISGFILPYSMAKSAYTLAASPLFLAKRVVRLEPPYLASIALVLVISYAATIVPGFHGPWPAYSVPILASHIGYSTALLGWPWINPVYWTLAIEFQFYLLLSLAFPLLTSGTEGRKAALLVAIIGASTLVPCNQRWAEAVLIVPFACIFAVGILAFWKRSAQMSLLNFWCLLTVVTMFAAYWINVPTAVVAFASGVMLSFVEMPTTYPIMVPLGRMSYSIYLMHYPIAPRCFHLVNRLDTGSYQALLGISLSTLVTLIVAYALYRFVEVPSLKLAASIKYQPRELLWAHSVRRERSRSA